MGAIRTNGGAIGKLNQVLGIAFPGYHSEQGKNIKEKVIFKQNGSGIMFGLFKYMFLSGNKAVYRSIAGEFHTNSFRVYRLAHGKRARNNKDYQILKSLRKHEIIEGVLRQDL